MNGVIKPKQHQTYFFIAVLSLVLNLACLIPLPRAQVVANCEIHGEIKMIDTDAPVENVMIFARYTFNKDIGTSKGPVAIGPIFSDANGRFIIPKFYKKQWYLEHLYMGDCGGDLLFIHPTLGAYSMLICTENFPPSLSSKELNVVQHTIDGKRTKEMVVYSYKAINRLPKDVQPKAWAHVNPEMRPK